MTCCFSVQLRSDFRRAAGRTFTSRAISPPDYQRLLVSFNTFDRLGLLQYSISENGKFGEWVYFFRIDRAKNTAMSRFRTILAGT